MTLQPETHLLEAWHEAKRTDPAARSRDIADQFGVTEGLLAETRVGHGIVRLACQGERFIDVLKALQGIGPVMTLTRNDAAVHETTGPIGEIAHHGSMGQILGAIDLRLFLRHWHAGYLVSEETRSGLRHSVQVFDATGIAVIKVYATGDTDMTSWDRALAPFIGEDELQAVFSPIVRSKPDCPDVQVDRDALRSDWQALEHSHDFHKLLRTHGVGRQQALRLAGDDLACPVEREAVHRMLDGAAATGVPIMCFVGSAGCIQIFSGPIETIKQMGPWLNILDPGFNLHLRTDRVAQAWAVRKPTRLRGTITSLELFDVTGDLVCQFFGSRPPGEGERESWREVVDTAISGAGK